MEARSFIKLFLISFVSFMLVGYFNSNTSMSELGYVWYDSLIKSPLTPANPVFGIVWTILYVFNALALATLLVNKRFTKGGYYEKGTKLFMIQFGLQFLWSYLFWLWLSPLWAFVDLIIVTFLVFLMLRNVCKISRLSAFLFLPYFFWLLFASYINFYILIHN